MGTRGPRCLSNGQFRSFVRRQRSRTRQTAASLMRFADRVRLDYLVNALVYAGRMYSDDVIKATLEYYTRAGKRALLRRTLDTARKLKLDASMTHENIADGTCDVDEALQQLFSNALLKGMLYREALPYLEARQAKPRRHARPTLPERKLQELQQTFGLSDIEVDVVVLMYLYGIDAGVERLYDDFGTLTNSRSSYLDVPTQTKQVAVLTNRPTRTIAAAIADNATLARTGLITVKHDLPDEVVRFLEGQSHKPIISNYFSEYTGDAIALDNHVIKPADMQAVQTLIENREPGAPVTLLLYGPPGTGKTKFAHSLGRHYGLKTYEIGTVDLEDGKAADVNAFRLRAYAACQRLVGGDQAMIIIDEADAMLNARPEFFSFAPVAEKGQVNTVLDQSRVLTVWITNRASGIEDSTSRRFDYAIRFEKLSFEQRCNVWRNAIRRRRLQRCFIDSDIERFASQFEVSAGGIDVALRNVARVYRRTRRKTGMTDLLETLLTSHLKVLNQDTRMTNASQAATGNYSLDGLHIKADMPSTLGIIDRFGASWPTADTADLQIRNLNLLLYGPPGAGKTELAKYIARRLKRRLLVKRASDLLSMYVGQTEKLIREAFREAEHDRAILFIDEADSMLGSREGAVRSWEISQVNELLTNMETFHGMLICSTNFKQAVDSAAIRRFNIKLEFDYLTPDGAEVFYRRFMDSLVSTRPSRLDLERLRTFPGLAPGDFKVVYQNHVLFEDGAITHGMLIDALRREVRARDSRAGRSVGFTKQ